MRFIGLACFTAAALGSTFAIAQTSPQPPNANVKLSQSECTNLWQQAGGSTAGLTASQSSAYISDFKAANPDGDTTIDQAEWMAACNKGLVKSSSNSGASTGESGSDAAKTSDRTPGDPAPSRTPGAANTGAAGTDAGQTPGGTSDRTPGK